MILATAVADTSLGQWGTFISIVLFAIGSFYIKVKSDKKETLAQQIQKEQRDCLRQIEIGQAAHNGKLSKVTEINALHYESAMHISQARHEELIRVLNNNCKAQPVNVQQINRSPEESSVSVNKTNKEKGNTV
jgi:hypothetical protein